MIITARSVAVGLAAWLLAFLIVVGAGCDPVHLTKLHVAAVVLSGIAGFVTAIVLGKTFCRVAAERGSAIMVFAVAFFAGIYAPFTAVWANARFYEWSAGPAATPKHPALTQYLAPAVEHTGSSHYVGAVLLLGLGWLVARRLAGASRTGRPVLSRLEYPDIGFGLATGITGLVGMVISSSSRMSCLQWVGYICGAFLLILLFRSIRLQWHDLRNLPSNLAYPPVLRTVGAIVIAGMLLTGATVWLVAQFPEMWLEFAGTWSPVLGFGLLGLWYLFGWVLFRLFTRAMPEALWSQSEGLGSFAIRCGFWMGVAITMGIGGPILREIAGNVLVKSSEVQNPGLATPFAITVVALKPFFALFILPGFPAAYIGGFLLGAILPWSSRASQRIVATAQAGAVMAVVSYLLLVILALNLALLSVPLIPVGHPLTAMVTGYFAHWWRLGLFEVVALGAMAAGGGMMYAAEASLVCGVVWLIRRCRAGREECPG